MTPAHFAQTIVGYDRLRHATGPIGSVITAANSTIASHTQNMTTTAAKTLAEQFRDKVEDHIKTTGVDYSAAWESCKKLYPDLWNAFEAQSKAANVRAANEAEQTGKDTAKTKSDALAEFQRRVTERMQSAGENYGAAWAFVSQTQPRLYARMNGDFATDKALSDQGLSLPVTTG